MMAQGSYCIFCSNAAEEYRCPYCTKQDIEKQPLAGLGALSPSGFKIFYSCLGCGGFIKYAWCPCLFCGYYPSSIQELATYHLLSAPRQSLSTMMAISHMISSKTPFEEKIPDWPGRLKRQMIKSKEDKSHSIFLKHTFKASFIESRLKIINVKCKNCGQQSILPYNDEGACLNCDESPDLSLTECWIVAVKCLLFFISEYDFEINESGRISFEELVPRLVGTLNYIVENDTTIDTHSIEKIRQLVGSIDFISSHELCMKLLISADSSDDIIRYKGSTEESVFAIYVLSANLSFINGKQKR